MKSTVCLKHFFRDCGEKTVPFEDKVPHNVETLECIYKKNGTL